MEILPTDLPDLSKPKFLKFHFFTFLLNIWVPGRFKKLREVRRIHFHLSWYLCEALVPSYVHLGEQVND